MRPSTVGARNGFCEGRTQSDYGAIKIEFSERGGHRYSQTSAYQYYWKHQQAGNKIYLKKREPVMEMLDWNLMKAYAHADRAGLQLADYVASYFYQAIDCLGSGTWDIHPALSIKPIMAKEGGFWHDFGVALFPTLPTAAKLTTDQKKRFKEYKYNFGKW